MEIDRGGKRKNPEEDPSSPLSSQPTTKPALETVETWVNLSPQIGAELFGQMDIDTFVQYCSASKAIRNWCDLVRSHYPTLFVRALEDMLVNSDIHSILATCTQKGGEIWQHAGYRNEEWVKNARVSNPHGYPQVRDEIWQTIFDTTILPCIPPLNEVNRQGNVQIRAYADEIWDMIRNATSSKYDWEEYDDIMSDAPRVCRHTDRRIHDQNALQCGDRNEKKRRCEEHGAEFSASLRAPFWKIELSGLR